MRPTFDPLTLLQKYILVGIVALAAAGFYVLRNLNGIAQMPLNAHLDIATFYAAAEAVFNGMSSPYSLAVLKVFKPDTVLHLFPFLYAPSALPFFWPLAGHDFASVYNLTLYGNAVLILLLITGLAIWTVRLSGSLIAGLLMVPLLTEGSRSLWATLFYGQINLVLAFLLLGALWALVRRWQLTAGVLLGITITLKIYPALLLPWLALRRDWKALGAALGTIAGLALLTWVWLPHYLWSEWLDKIVLAGGYGSVPQGFPITVADKSNINLIGMLTRSLGDSVAVKLVAYGSALTLAAIAIISAYKRPHCTTAHYASLLWLTLLVAPLTWLSHLSYVLFAVVWFVAMAWRDRQFIWALIFAAVYGVLPQLTMQEHDIPLWQQNAPVAGLLLLWGMMQFQIWRRPAGQAVT